MDALDFLHAEHERIKALFRDYNEVQAIQRKRLVFDNIRKDLTAHFYIEETVFYPAFADFEETKDLVEQAREEHGSAKEDLMSLQNSQTIDARFESKFSKLVKEVEDHIQKEEKEFFPRVRKLMRRPERDRMGRLLQAARTEQAEAA